MGNLDSLLLELIGLSRDEGVELCVDNNVNNRIVREDEDHYIITMDLRFDRVNIECDNGIITKTYLG